MPAGDRLGIHERYCSKTHFLPRVNQLVRKPIAKTDLEDSILSVPSSQWVTSIEM